MVIIDLKILKKVNKKGGLYLERTLKHDRDMKQEGINGPQV